ncbi:hypothetical protein, partial [Clostridium perfringens]|uniref:hypothetical protein n=1 Tax=Clostridium perfringens TaxID=1502 RepID=UPI001FB16F2B
MLIIFNIDFLPIFFLNLSLNIILDNIYINIIPVKIDTIQNIFIFISTAGDHADWADAKVYTTSDKPILTGEEVALNIGDS